MKQKWINWSARCKARAKCSRASTFWDAHRKIIVYHVYDDVKPDALTYWDDVEFHWGSKPVAIAWTHPRYEYTEELQHRAYEETELLFPGKAEETRKWFEDTIPIYKKLGNSRKKVTMYECKHTQPDEFYPTWTARTNELCATSDYVVKPSYKATVGYNSIFVTCCLPIEVRNRADLLTLVNLVRNNLDQKIDILAQFPDFVYNNETYKVEFPEGWLK